MAKIEEEMIPVPIPTEVPAPPRLDQIPLDILHSATVELLIQQNEDLSSRLKVNIRRNSQLELRIIENERVINELNKKRENVLAQMEIIKEKENLWYSQRTDRLKQIENLQEEKDLFELRYNELYTTSQQKGREQREDLIKKQTEIRNLQEKLSILMRVRSRAKEKLRELLLEMATGFESTVKKARQSESSQRLLRKNFEGLKSEINEKESLFHEQLDNLKKVSQNAVRDLDQKLSQANERSQRLEREKQELHKEISALSAELHEEKKNRNKIAELTEELNSLKNERIRFKRDMQQAVRQSEEARKTEISKTEKTEEKLQEIEKQFNEHKELLSSCEDKLLKVSKENKELSDQLNSVQNLWIQAQDTLEKTELRNQSLEKINRQLSRQSQEEKVSRATEKAQETQPEKDRFEEKVKDVFASQYRTFAPGPELDV